MTVFEPQGGLFRASVSPLMGTRLEFLCAGTPEAVIRPVWEAFEQEVRALGDRLDRFRPESEVSRVNAAGGLPSPGPGGARAGIRVSRELASLLRLAGDYGRRTGGLFDIALGHPWRLSEDGLLTLDGEVDFGGFAKGYALRLLGERLRGAGVASAFADFGGSSILAVGHHPFGDSWPVEVRSPFDGTLADTWALKDAALSTSGNAPGYEGHIIHPRTGAPLRGRILATVMAPDPLDAEVLSTALLLATPAEERRLADAWPDAVLRRYDPDH